MPSLRVEAHDLREGSGEDTLKDLEEFLEERLDVEVSLMGGELIISPKEEGREKAIPKRRLRILLRKFLHQFELREDYRIISGGENLLIIKERRRPRIRGRR